MVITRLSVVTIGGVITTKAPYLSGGVLPLKVRLQALVALHIPPAVGLTTEALTTTSMITPNITEFIGRKVLPTAAAHREPLTLERVTARVSPRLLVTPRTTTPVVAPHIQQTGQ